MSGQLHDPATAPIQEEITSRLHSRTVCYNSVRSVFVCPSPLWKH